MKRSCDSRAYKHRQDINSRSVRSNAPNNTGTAKEIGGWIGVGRGPCKSEHTEDLPDVIGSNARNVSGTIAQSVSGKRERMQFRSRCSRVLPSSPATVPAAVCEVLRPVSYFQKGVKGECFRKIYVSFLFFFIFPSFLLVSFDLPTANFYPPRSVQVQFFALRCFLT